MIKAPLPRFFLATPQRYSTVCLFCKGPIKTSPNMYRASVNQQVFEIEGSGDALTLNNARLDWDIVPLGNGHYHILHQGQGYSAELVKVDSATKTFTLKINGQLQVVELKDKFDLLLEKMGMQHTGAGKVNNIKAPMPGLIIDLKISAGDTVKAGDPLLILEAMKMENILKSPGDGVVKSIKIKKGDSVEKGQVLVEF